ncbi:MAG: hypothetical protein RLZZ350_2004, partial [Verrucomicrobiota bacterium]
RHHRGPAAHHVESRRGRGRDETHRHADDRRRHHLDADGTAGLSGDFLRVAGEEDWQDELNNEMLAVY